MSRSGASLVKIWEYEGQSSAATPKSNSEMKINANSSAVKAELLKYYQTHGMEHMAKEVGIIHTNGDANTTRIQGPTTPRKVIALPIHTTKSAVFNMSPFKMEQAILPKSVHISNSPVILSTPQRVANVISSPRTPQSLLSPSSDLSSWSGKRPYSMTDSDYSDSKRCKKGEKGGKGLRHFSMKVCEKVRKKGTTSYNEVADELVAEFTDPHRNICPTEQAYDQKNIRRRVYDALNVLMAMSIISKEKKEIKWLGLPTNSAQEYQNLEREKQKRLDRIRTKTQRVQELILQQIAFKNLVEKNKLKEKESGHPRSKISLPFVVINTEKQTVVECCISPDKSEFMFNFNDKFRISDDIEIMKRMGMVLNLDTGTASEEELEKAKLLVPKALQPYVTQMAHGLSEYPPGMTSDGKCIKMESDLYSEPTSDFQEASSSSMLGSDFISGDIALETSNTALSRQSSVGSLSDLPSRQEASTPSDYSDSEPDSSGDDDEI